MKRELINMHNKKSEALIKMNEAIAYLSEAFIEEDQIFNQIHDELQNIIAWGKAQDDKIYKLIKEGVDARWGWFKI